MISTLISSSMVVALNIHSSLNSSESRKNYNLVDLIVTIQNGKKIYLLILNLEAYQSNDSTLKGLEATLHDQMREVKKLAQLNHTAMHRNAITLRSWPETSCMMRLRDLEQRLTNLINSAAMLIMKACSKVQISFPVSTKLWTIRLSSIELSLKRLQNSV